MYNLDRTWNFTAVWFDSHMPFCFSGGHWLVRRTRRAWIQRGQGNFIFLSKIIIQLLPVTRVCMFLFIMHWSVQLFFNFCLNSNVTGCTWPTWVAGPSWETWTAGISLHQADEHNKNIEILVFCWLNVSYNYDKQTNVLFIYLKLSKCCEYNASNKTHQQRTSILTKVRKTNCF